MAVISMPTITKISITMSTLSLTNINISSINCIPMNTIRSMISICVLIATGIGIAMVALMITTIRIAVIMNFISITVPITHISNKTGHISIVTTVTIAGVINSYITSMTFNVLNNTSRNNDKHDRIVVTVTCVTLIDVSVCVCVMRAIASMVVIRSLLGAVLHML